MPKFGERIMPNNTEQDSQREALSSSAEIHTPQQPDPLLDPSEIEAARFSDAQTSLARITELETVLGPLPESRAQNTTVAAEAELTPEQETALGEISLNEERITGCLENVCGSFLRIDKVIQDDAYSSQSMLRIGRVLEERGNLDQVAQQMRLLSESFAALDKTNDMGEKVTAVRETQQVIEGLAAQMDDLYQFLSQLQRKTADYYDGRNNEDEDFLRHLQQQLNAAFEDLKQMSLLCHNEETMLTDYQKTFSM